MMMIDVAIGSTMVTAILFFACCLCVPVCCTWARKQVARAARTIRRSRQTKTTRRNIEVIKIPNHIFCWRKVLHEINFFLYVNSASNWQRFTRPEAVFRFYRRYFIFLSSLSIFPLLTIKTCIYLDNYCDLFSSARLRRSPPSIKLVMRLAQ